MSPLLGPLTLLLVLGNLGSFAVMAISLFRSTSRTYSRSDTRRELTSDELFYRRRFWFALAIWILTGLLGTFFSRLIEG